MDDTKDPDFSPAEVLEVRSLEAKLEDAIRNKKLELLAAGVSPEESSFLAEEHGRSKLEEIAVAGLEILKTDLRERARSMDHANTEYRAVLQDHWTESLDKYRLAAEGCFLAGTRLRRLAEAEDLGQQRLDLQSALTGTWARSARTALEVETLLRAGFPLGAGARARTMHEFAVTAFILSDYGTQEEHLDLGSRYLSYGAVKVLKDALEYQQHCAELGQKPLPEEEMQRYRQNYVDALQTYPDLGRSSNGWAARLPGYKRGTLKELEQMAGLNHYRPYYSWFSYDVHSNVKGDRLNMVATPDGRRYHVGLRMDGLADPADAALRALHQIVAAWGTVCELDVMTVTFLRCSRMLVNDAAEALAGAEAKIASTDTSSGPGTGRQ